MEKTGEQGTPGMCGVLKGSLLLLPLWEGNREPMIIESNELKTEEDTGKQ